jgi:hypothetical protein
MPSIIQVCEILQPKCIGDVNIPIGADQAARQDIKWPFALEQEQFQPVD